MITPGQATVTLFRPVGQREMELIRQSGDRAFPPRLPSQPIFYPVLTEQYAREIAERWNTRDELSGFVGYVTRFQVTEDYIRQHPVRNAGSEGHQEYWIPAAELDELNANIVGPIEIIAEFRPSEEPGV